MSYETPSLSLLWVRPAPGYDPQPEILNTPSLNLTAFTFFRLRGPKESFWSEILLDVARPDLISPTPTLVYHRLH
jgi:hypothetical protein